MQYTAHNIDKRSEVWTDFHICRDCIGPAPAKNETGFEKCWAIKNYNRHYSSKTRSFSGVTNMKAELAAYGPISCGIAATSKFQQYKGGIYSETLSGRINNIISVVGYGKDETTGEEYWIGRNSWGTYWGEYGFFRIKMYKNNNSIEKSYAAGYPTDKKAEDVINVTE